MPTVGADAGDADEGAASPSGGSLRLLLLLLALELMASICFVRNGTKKFGGSCTTYVGCTECSTGYDPGEDRSFVK